MPYEIEPLAWSLDGEWCYTEPLLAEFWGIFSVTESGDGTGRTYRELVACQRTKRDARKLAARIFKAVNA